MQYFSVHNVVSTILPEKFKKFIIKRRNSWIAKKRILQKKSALKRYGYFDKEELTDTLQKFGIQDGAVLFVQSSYNDMYTFKGGPLDILKSLRAVISDKGTLLMPSYTKNVFEDTPRVFDVTTEPTYTGTINELFRRTPGVIRSLHPRHSICGQGPLASNLLSGHESCVRADGPDSPFDRLRKMDHSYILTLGLPMAYISFLHWVEDYEPENLPFQVHEEKPLKCTVHDNNGNEFFVYDWRIKKEISRTVAISRIGKRLSTDSIKHCYHKGINFYLYPIKTLSKELLRLRDAGIIHYK